MLNTAQCLLDKGLITQGQYEDFVKAQSALPYNETDLLKLIAGLSLSGISGGVAPPVNPLVGAPLGSASVNSTSPSNIKSIPALAGATKALITPLGNNIIFRLDGGVPSVTQGHFAAQGSNIIVTDLTLFNFISASSANSTCFITYYA